MTDAEYSDILLIHGRRVANRAVLSQTDMAARLLADFHDCYGSEQPLQECAEPGKRFSYNGTNIGLPTHERCSTSLIATFDPCGFHAFYIGTTLDSWPAPPQKGADTDDEPPSDAALAIKIQNAARLICSSLAGLHDLAQIKRRGDALISEHAAALSARYRIDLNTIHDLLGDAAEEVMTTMLEDDDGDPV